MTAYFAGDLDEQLVAYAASEIARQTPHIVSMGLRREGEKLVVTARVYALGTIEAMGIMVGATNRSNIAAYVAFPTLEAEAITIMKESRRPHLRPMEPSALEELGT